MDESKLKSIVSGEIADALGSFLTGSSTSASTFANLSSQRERNMNYYLGLPFGNEVEGQSKVISTDVMDVVEWMKPALIRIFASSDKAVSFEPFGVEDEAQAEQETDYCNYVFFRENNGFLVFNEWFTDALIQKVGYVKLYPEKQYASTVETYENLSDEEYQLLITDEELEPIEHSGRVELIMGQPMMLHDLKVRRSSNDTKICIVPVPPEEMLVSRKTLSIDLNTSPFVCHRTRKTISDLVSQGFDRTRLESLGTAEVNTTPESLARYNFDATSPEDKDSLDPSMREVWVNEAYLKVDFDEDGIAELRRVTMIGNEIFENEETDIIPFSAITPTILPHKHHGLCPADQAVELQLWRSTLLRQIIQNTYLANNQRYGAVEGRCNLDDLLEPARVGGIVRVKDPSAVFPLQYNPLPQQAFQLFELSEGIKENRTGVTRYNQGTDADSLNKTASGVNQIMTASQQRPDLVARVFAETGVKDLFIKLHGMLIKYSDKEKIVKLNNRYVPVDPREWRNRYNVIISVGLGTGNKEQIINSMVAIRGLQKDMKQSGAGHMVTDANEYAAAKKMSEAMGFKEESFFTDPSMVQKPPPPPDPQMVQIQAFSQVEQGKLQLEGQKLQQEGQLGMLELQLKEKDSQRDAEIEMLKAQIQAMSAGVKAETGKMKTIAEVTAKDAEMRIRQVEAILNERDSERNLQMVEQQHVGKMMEAGSKLAGQHQKMKHDEKMAEKKLETLTLPKDKPKK